MIILGIDPSMESSGICKMYLDSEYNIEKINFYGYYKVRKWCIDTDSVKITCVGSNYNQLPIYERIDKAIGVFDQILNDVEMVSIEDFSYGSAVSNSTYQIGEFVGAIRKYIYDKKIPIYRYSPVSIKIYATGSHTASKFMMMQAFKQKFPEIFPPEIEDELKLNDSPQVDLNDAFWIADILRTSLKMSDQIEIDDDIEKKMTKNGKKGKKKTKSLSEIIPEHKK